MRILLIDDDEMILKVMETHLKKEGHEIIKATESSDAFRLIAEENLDLIISDIMMPYMSGIELLGYINTELKKNTPVILMSALDQDEVIQTAIKMGASDYLIKPFNQADLSSVIDKVLN